MRSDVNLAVQLGLVSACGLVRLCVTPGWLLLILGLPWVVLVLVQIVLAAVAAPRRHLSVPVAIGFWTADFGLLAGTLVTPDGGDSDASFHSPLGLLLGHEYPDLAWPAGMLLGLVWFAGLLATMIALIVTRPRPPVWQPPAWQPPYPVAPAAYGPVPPYSAPVPPYGAPTLGRPPFTPPYDVPAGL